MSIALRAVVLGALTLLGSCQLSDPEQTSVQEGFVLLIPRSSVQTEVRYFSAENFVGEVIDGETASGQ